jgi:hypothetical protein
VQLRKTFIHEIYLFFMNWENIAIIGCQLQDTSGQFKERQCSLGRYFGNVCTRSIFLPAELQMSPLDSNNS